MASLGAWGETAESWRNQVALVRVLADNDAPLAYRQAKQLASLLPANSAPSDQTLILNVLARIEIHLALTEPAASHASQALDLATNHGDRVGQIEALLNVALNAINQGRMDALANSTTRAVALLDGLDRPDLLVEALLRTSMMYHRIGQSNESVTMTLQAMEVARTSDNPRVLAYAHQGLADSYEQSDHKDKAIEHFKAMSLFAKQANSKLLEAYALTSLAKCRSSSETPCGDENKIKDAVSLFRTSGAPFGLAHGLTVWAEIMNARKQMSASLRGYTEVISIYERYPNKFGLLDAYQARSKVQQEVGNLTAALEDADQANKIANELGIAIYRSNSAQRLGELAWLNGDFKKAYSFAKDAISLNAQANQHKIANQVGELAQRYETEIKRRQIESLTRQTEKQSIQQRWLWTVLSGSVAILAGTAYFVVRLRRSHRLQRMINEQLHQSREKLEQQTSILESILNSIGDGVTVANETGGLVLVNPAAQKLSAQIKCSPYLEVGSDGAASATELREPHLKTIPLARAIRGDSCDKEELFLRTEAVPEGIWLSVTARPLFNKNGEIRGGVAVFSNITAQKNAEELLRKSEREFRTLAENSPDIIVRYDATFRQIYANPACRANTGISASDALTPHAGWENCIAPSFDEYQAAIQDVLCTGTPSELYMEWRRQDGNVRCYAVNVVPERGRDDGVIGALAIGHDITALKQAEKRLEESYAMLREHAAHRESAREEERAKIARELHDELGQLLTALRLGISTLRLQFGATNPLLGERISSLTELADKTLQGMRDVAALLRPPALDMGISAALEWLVGEFSRHTTVSCQFNAPRYKINLEEARSIAIFRLVQESLTNVARHAHARNVIVSFKEEDGAYRLEVRDDGRGFDPSAVKGRHFGLAGIRERAALIGGKVVIESAIGKGTAIQVKIPVTESMEQAS